MIPFYLSEISQFINAEHKGIDCLISSITINSKIIYDDKCLFVAIKGNKFDSHIFVKQAISLGAIALLVNIYQLLDIPQLIVDDTILALGRIGYWFRKRVSTKIIALTGSSGKTTVKEMTTFILSYSGKLTLSTYNNFNNKIGVPLTLLNLTSKHNFAVIEIGVSNINEMKWLTSLIKPEIILLNNIYESHLLGFGNLSNIIKEKSEIFSYLKKYSSVIINNNLINFPILKKKLLNKKIWSFANKFNYGVNFFASNVHYIKNKTYFHLHSPQGTDLAKISLLGCHNITNALAASALAMSAGVELPIIIKGLAKIKAIPGRLFPIKLSSNILLLDDSYNANVGSMISAIKTLSKMSGYKIMVVGDMLELGVQEYYYHYEIGKIINSFNINKVLSVGILSYLISDASKCGEHFKNKLILYQRLLKLILKYKKCTILIKGSRNSFMEEIIVMLKKDRCLF